MLSWFSEEPEQNGFNRCLFLARPCSPGDQARGLRMKANRLVETQDRGFEVSHLVTRFVRLSTEPTMMWRLFYSEVHIQQSCQNGLPINVVSAVAWEQELLSDFFYLLWGYIKATETYFSPWNILLDLTLCCPVLTKSRTDTIRITKAKACILFHVKYIKYILDWYAQLAL